MAAYTLLNDVFHVEQHAAQNDWVAFLEGNRNIYGSGRTGNEAIGDVIRTHPEEVIEVIVNKSSKVRELQAALQETALALTNVCGGYPVRNVPHCLAAAEKLTAGSDYEFKNH